MNKKIICLIAYIFSLSLINNAMALPLQVDIGRDGQPLKAGWQRFDGPHDSVREEKNFDFDGTTVSVAISIGNGHPAGYRDYGGGAMGGDMVYPEDDSHSGPVDGSVILTLNNIPAGRYLLTAYHNDSKDTHDPHGPLNVTVSGAVSDSSSDLDGDHRVKLFDFTLRFAFGLRL